MAGKVLKFNKGYAGQISRSIDNIIDSYANADTGAIAFGAPVALVNGEVKNVSATNTNVIGIAARTIKTEESYGQNDAKYMPNEMVDVILRGTVTVYVPTGTPSAGGKVYIVKATGAIAVAADSDNTIEMADWLFKGGVDENKIAEIVLTKRAF